MLSFQQKLLSRIFAISVALAPLAALGQQYQELPPNSVIGNVSNGPTAPGSAVSLDVLAASLMSQGQLVKGPATATPGHAVVFGAGPTTLADGGGLAGSGTVTSVGCGNGLSGGTINVSGTCALAIPITPQGRITLASATPVMTTSVPGATSVIYTPYTGDLVPLFDGTNMNPTAVSEISQSTTDTTKSPAAVAPSSIYDLFIWSDSGTVRISRGPAWTNSTTRSLALTRVNGILLNASSITNGPASQRGTWVGTVASNSASTVDYILGGSASDGTAAVLNVWNAFNRVTVAPQVTDTSGFYAYSPSTIRQANNSAGNQVSFVLGAVEDGVSASYTSQCTPVATSTAFCNFGIGLDSTTTFATAPFRVETSAATSITGGGSLSYQFMPSIGTHVLSGNEQGDGSHSNDFNSASNGMLSASLRM